MRAGLADAGHRRRWQSCSWHSSSSWQRCHSWIPPWAKTLGLPTSSLVSGVMRVKVSMPPTTVFASYYRV